MADGKLVEDGKGVDSAMNDAGAPKKYRFGEFQFDPEKLELRRSGGLTPLKLQPARLLKILLENSPDTVSRKTLQEKIWDNGTTVEFEQGLNACVNQLRTTLGDSASDPRFIATLPKRGYRFVAPVEFENADTLPSKPRSSLILATVLLVAITFGALWYFVGQTPSKAPVRIYVAPVQIAENNLSEFEGITEYALRLGTVERLMRNDLDVLQTINGVSLWSDIDNSNAANSYDYRLFLTLSSGDDEYIVDAIMVGANAGREFDRQIFHAQTLDPGSLAALSDDISTWSSALFGSNINLSREPDVEHEAAYFDAMVRARRVFQIGDLASLQESLKWFEQALEIEPNSIDAKGGKALALAVLSGKKGFPKAATYELALSLADEIRQSRGPTPQSELTRGFVYLYRDWEIERARRAFDLAAELAPGDAVVHAWRAGVLAAQGDPKSAALEADVAVRLDPLSMAVISDRCWYLSAARRFEEAVDACEWALEIVPGHSWATIGLSVALSKLNRHQEALNALTPIMAALKNAQNQSAESLLPESGPAENDTEQFRLVQCEMADLLTPRAEQGEFPLFDLAAFNAQCGRSEAAVSLLEDARRAGESGILFYQIDPRFDEFRALPVTGSLDTRPVSRG